MVISLRNICDGDNYHNKSTVYLNKKINTIECKYNSVFFILVMQEYRDKDMRIIYLAILSKWDDGDGYTIRIPDFKGCVSEGETLEETIAMGTDAACGYIITELKEGNKIPKPSKQSNLKIKKDELTSLIICDIT